MTQEGVDWVPFTDEHAMTFADPVDAHYMSKLIAKSGVLHIPANTSITDHTWTAIQEEYLE